MKEEQEKNTILEEDENGSSKNSEDEESNQPVNNEEALCNKSDNNDNTPQSLSAVSSPVGSPMKHGEDSEKENSDPERLKQLAEYRLVIL